MKKLFLTFAMLFMVSFAFANDGAEKPESKDYKAFVADYNVITSCGTTIYVMNDECNDENVLFTALWYECQHCGSECDED